MNQPVNKYTCETCEKPCSQVYGNKVNNKYTFKCKTCTFKKK